MKGHDNISHESVGVNMCWFQCLFSIFWDTSLLWEKFSILSCNFISYPDSFSSRICVIAHQSRHLFRQWFIWTFVCFCFLIPWVRKLWSGCQHKKCLIFVTTFCRHTSCKNYLDKCHDFTLIRYRRQGILFPETVNQSPRLCSKSLTHRCVRRHRFFFRVVLKTRK
jgi:hypothetical protein